MGVMIAPVEGSGVWPAWMQTVLKRAPLRSFTMKPAYYTLIRPVVAGGSIILPTR